MIFVTVGAQMPFDRMINAVDNWADNTTRVIAQIGDSKLQPQHIEAHRFLTPTEFSGLIRDAEVVVSHAGMGTILSVMTAGRPLILFPRRGSLRETRNDHQVDTAKWFVGKPGITVAFEERELHEALSRFHELSSPPQIAAVASDELIHTLRSFIRQADISGNKI